MSIRKPQPEDGQDAYVSRIARAAGVSPVGVLFVRCRLALWHYRCQYARPLPADSEGLPVLPFFSLGLGPSDRRFVATFLDIFRRRPVR